MRSAVSGGARLREDVSAMIESKELALSNLQKGYLRSRWLEQMLQINKKYGWAYKSYYALRLITIVGCLLILLSVSLSANGAEWQWGNAVRGFTIFSSLLVSVCVAVEHLFGFGESCHQYERTAERLKAEGWRFLQLSGSYQGYKSHSDAFAVFANQVEALSQTDVEVYNFDVVHERNVGPESDEVERQKKFDDSPTDGAELIETPVMMHSMVRRHANPQRTQ
jgi:hypothetical protein